MKTIMKYAKIDMKRVRRMKWMLVIFPAIAIFLNLKGGDDYAVFSTTYCMFAGIVISLIPFQYEKKQETGFLRMLPSRPGSDIAGHFLFGAISVFAGFWIGVLAAAVSALFSESLRGGLLGLLDYPGVVMVILGVALLITAGQSLVFCVFRFDQVNGLQFIRIVPAFIFFFGMTYISGEPKLVQAAMRLGEWLPGLAVLLLCIILFIAAAYLGVRVGERKYRM